MAIQGGRPNNRQVVPYPMVRDGRAVVIRVSHTVVVVVVAGEPLAHGKYPFAYWGRLGGGGMKDQTVNWAWRQEDRDNVTYAAHDITPPIGAGGR